MYRKGVNMRFNTVYSDNARQDLSDMHEHLISVLHKPHVVAEVTTRLVFSIGLLEEEIVRHNQYQHEPWKSKKLYRTTVSNFLVFYLINIPERIIYIVRVMHSSRDFQKCLESFEWEDM